jgi:hypothetical protein
LARAFALPLVALYEVAVVIAWPAVPLLMSIAPARAAASVVACSRR